MNNYHNVALTKRSQRLRKEMTAEERKLWYHFLKSLPFPVKRQKIITNYIVDFKIPTKRIIIEIDGSQHYMNEGFQSDIIRDETLANMGFTVLRYSNDDVRFNFDAVCESILNKLN